MTQPLELSKQPYPDPHQESYARTLIGFWVYIMTDCILFSVLFTTYVVLHNATFGGPTSHEIFDLSTALTETLILLASSFTSGIALLAAHNKKKVQVLFWIAITFVLGAAFLAIELREFISFVQEGHDWTRSAFLSAFFTLVGTHGAHITVGLVWMLVLIGQLAARDLDIPRLRRLACWSMFWHFLDVVWIFIFTIVYLMGVS